MAEIGKINFNRLIPAGFRSVETILQSPSGPVKVEGLVPDTDNFPKEAKRLSRKVLRGSSYTPDTWNDELKTVVRTREHYEPIVIPQVGTVQRTLREIHDATLPPDESLRQIHLISMHDRGYKRDNYPVYAMEYMVYGVADDLLENFQVSEYNESIDLGLLMEAFAQTRALGASSTSDRERVLFYTGLTYMAGE